ncbi:MAG TPA: hemerythrin domain-containing protein [Labilithrix sp.]|nr:hemerythrin domain-containing protein [Labilithrix sp.]
MSSPLISTLKVRERIADDLALIRGLTRGLLAFVQVADERQRAVIVDVLAQLSSEMERHYAYEREVIVPLLRDVDAWGPVRVEQLCKEHEEQQSVLLALTEDAHDGTRPVEDLAEEIVWFFQRFEQEILDEEDRLLGAEVIGAEPLVDQIDG